MYSYLSISSLYTSDKEPPVIHCPENVAVFAEYGHTETSVTWEAPTVLDNSGQVIGMNLSHVPGSSFFIGSTGITYTVWDEARNTGACTFYIEVNGKLWYGTICFTLLKVYCLPLYLCQMIQYVPYLLL